uniref:Reverse transcriptase domain-containing protein n=1 Tax=Schistosoma curassoni TaxID=6186 RepID=A0A183JL78_9TREM
LDRIKEKNKKTAIDNSRTRTEKVQAKADYIEANKQVKKSIRADKNKYVEGLATTAEKAAREGNMKQLYDTTKKLEGNYSKPERPVKDKESRPITEIQQQRNRWVECFEGLLNRPAPMSSPDIEALHTDLPVDFNPPTTEGIRLAIRQIESGKPAGPKNISAETLKVLLNRMKDVVDAQLRDQQAGFRKDRSCTDQIVRLRIIVEQSVEWNSTLYINFIDNGKAFDSVDRRTSWKLLRHYGVPD